MGGQKSGSGVVGGGGAILVGVRRRTARKGACGGGEAGASRLNDGVPELLTGSAGGRPGAGVRGASAVSVAAGG